MRSPAAPLLAGFAWPSSSGAAAATTTGRGTELRFDGFEPSSLAGGFLGLGEEGLGMLLHQAVQRGLLETVALEINRRDIGRSMGLPTLPCTPCSQEPEQLGEMPGSCPWPATAIILWLCLLVELGRPPTGGANSMGTVSEDAPARMHRVFGRMTADVVRWWLLGILVADAAELLEMLA